MRRIAPCNLWIGHAGDSRAFRTLLAEGVQAVVQIAFEEPPLAAPRELMVVRIPLLDGSGNDPTFLRLAVHWTSELIASGTSTLVCCGAGMSRSPAVVAVALSLVEGSNPRDCLQRITAGHASDVSPALWNDLLGVVNTK